jgi:hypothetical protein
MEKKLMTFKGRLRWFLDLINLDVNSTSDRDIFNLWIGLRQIAYGPLGVYALRDNDLIRWPKRREQTKEIRKVLKGLLEKILSISKKPKRFMIRPQFKEMPEYGFKDENRGRPGVALESIILSDIQKKPISKWAKDYIASTSTIEIKILADGDNVFTYFSKPEDKLLLEFSSLLSQFPLSSIQRCQREDCGAYFLKSTVKEKRYCSNRCAWVMASRERRMSQPEKEREKKRKSYERKRKREIGPNVKVTRRPRKEE